MTRNFRLLLITVSIPMFAACADTMTGPDEVSVRRDTTEETLVAMGCGDFMPWGKGPCVLE